MYDRPELELLLSCARVETNQREIDAIAYWVQQEIDWQYFLITASLQKVTPLVYFNFKKLDTENIPSYVMEYLTKFVRAKTTRNLLLLQELLRVQSLFTKNQIPTIPYKGILLAASIYGDLSLRQFLDIDFLVPRANYQQAQQLLLDIGYTVPPQKYAEWESNFVHPQKQIGVDLHQGFTPSNIPLQVNFEELWQRLESVYVGGIKLKSFAVEDLLIVLVVQLAKDSQWTAEVLIKVCDIAELIRVRQDLNWDGVWQQCKQLGTKRILLFGLCTAEYLLGAKLPEHIKNKIARDEIARQAATEVSKTLLLRPEKDFKERIFKERKIINKMSRELLPDKLNYLVERVSNKVFSKS